MKYTGGNNNPSTNSQISSVKIRTQICINRAPEILSTEKHGGKKSCFNLNLLQLLLLVHFLILHILRILSSLFTSKSGRLVGAKLCP